MKYFSHFYFFGLFCRKFPHSLSYLSYCSRSALPQQTDGDDCSCSDSELFSFLSVCLYFIDIRFSFNPKYLGSFSSLSNCAMPLNECETQNNIHTFLYYLYWRLADFRFLYDANHQTNGPFLFENFEPDRQTQTFRINLLSPSSVQDNIFKIEALLQKDVAHLKN